MLLQHQGNGAPQPSHAVFMDRYQLGRDTSGKPLGLHFGLNHGAETMPGAGQIADDHDLFGVQSGNHHAHAAAQKMGHGFESFGGFMIALIGQAEQVLEVEAFLGARFKVVAKGRAVGGEHFPAAAAPATAQGAVRVERHMPELAGHSAEPAREASVDQNAGARAAPTVTTTRLRLSI